MSHVFISYARPTAGEAQAVAAALRSLGYEVWLDDEIPAHRAYADVIEERLNAAAAVVVIWSAEAVKSQWVQSEADRAREEGKLVQLNLDGARLPMPFDRIQCADLAGWSGDPDAPGWRKVVASLAELTGLGKPTRVEAANPKPLVSDRPSIAVLPFANLPGAADEAYLADGIVDEIVTALSRFPALLVIGSRTSLTYRGDTRAAADIARELGVRFLLDGSVRRVGGSIRIAVKLTDGATGGQVWAERFDARMEDIFSLQDQVAVSAAAQIAPSIEAAYTRRALARPTEDLSAYELYLRAVHLERAFTREALEDGIASVDLALARDPNFALALSFSSLLHALLVLNGWADDPARTTTEALERGRRALNSGMDDAEVLAHVATVLIWVGEDATSADAIVGRALSLNPGASLPWFASAWIKAFDGRPGLAMEQWDRHMRLDPRTPLYAFVAGGRGIALTLLQRFDEAVSRLQEALHLVPEQRIFRTVFAGALAHAGRADEATRAAAVLTPQVIDNAVGLFRRPEDRELIAAGLRLAAPTSRPGPRGGGSR